MKNDSSNNYSNDDYHIYQSAKNLHLYVTKYISSKIPKFYANLRVCLMDECCFLIKNIYSSYYTDGSIRKKYVNLSCVSISAINHYFQMLSDLHVIDNKMIVSISKLLSDIKISLFAWRNKIILEK